MSAKRSSTARWIAISRLKYLANLTIPESLLHLYRSLLESAATGPSCDIATLGIRYCVRSSNVAIQEERRESTNLKNSSSFSYREWKCVGTAVSPKKETSRGFSKVNDQLRLFVSRSGGCRWSLLVRRPAVGSILCSSHKMRPPHKVGEPRIRAKAWPCCRGNTA